MPPADPELARLLDAYGQAEYEWGSSAHTQAGMHGDLGRRQHARKDAARAALLAYLNRAYLRLPPPLDGEPVRMEDAPGDDYRRRP